MKNVDIKEIVLQPGKRFYRVEEIAELIACAVHPHGDDYLVIEGLRKLKKWTSPFTEEEIIRAHQLREMGDIVGSIKAMPLWRPIDEMPAPEPLTEEECRLISEIWLQNGLLPLEVPITSTAFVPYRKALAGYLASVDWDLDAVVTKGNALCRDEAEIAQLKLLSDAIEKGELRVFSVNTHAPMSHFDELGKVTVDDTAKYLQKLGFQIRIEEMLVETIPNALHSMQNTVQQEVLFENKKAENDAPSWTEFANEPDLSKREKQIRVIERLAKELNYDVMNIPTGGKSKLREKCKNEANELFGAGDDPFKDAWKIAINSDPPRLRMAEHNKFAGK